MPEAVKEYLTPGLRRDSGVIDVRCPGCGHLQMKYKPHPATWIERKCKCKTLFRVIAHEITAVLA